MAREIKDILVSALEQADKDGTSMKEYLSNCLAGSEREVQDESLFKRKRGRPRKDSDGDLGDLPDDRFGRAAMLAEKKAKARLKDRLNPGTTKDDKKRIELNAELREIGWDFEECPGRDSELAEFEDDLDVLRKEAGNPDEDFGQVEDYAKALKEFRELRDDAVMYYGKAREYLEKKDFRRTEELVPYLKTKPAEIARKFETLEKSYDALCEAFCSFAASDKGEMGAFNPASVEVETHGFGMMFGEDFQTYSKRMKSIGMGRDIPKTIRDVDEIVEHTERRWRSVAGISQADFDDVKDNWQKTVRGMLKKSFLASSTKIAGLNRIFEIGLDFGDYDRGYGILQPMNPFVSAVPMGSQYGEIVVKWKPYKAVATMSFADSIAIGRGGLNYICPSFVTAPSPCSFSPEAKELVGRLKNEVLDIGIRELCELVERPYCELQLHGDAEDYDAEAIDSIYFSSDYEVCNLSLDALSGIEANGISLFVKGDPVKVEDGKIVRMEEEGGDK